MPDYRSMYDRDYIYAFDLGGRDVVVTISKVTAGTLTAAGGRKSKKPVVHFLGKDKGLAINKTNGKAIAAMYGPDTANWAGKKITLFPTTTEMGGETVDCIRVRPRIPQDEGSPRRSGGNRPVQSDVASVDETPPDPPDDAEMLARIDRGEA